MAAINNDILNDPSGQPPTGSDSGSAGYNNPVSSSITPTPFFFTPQGEAFWEAMQAIQHFRFNTPSPDHFDGKPLEKYIDILWVAYLSVEIDAIEAGLKK